MRKTEATNEIVIRRIKRTEFDKIFQLVFARAQGHSGAQRGLVGDYRSIPLLRISRFGFGIRDGKKRWLMVSDMNISLGNDD